MMTNKELIAKFRDMADIADASYAFLDEVYKIDDWSKIFGDNITLGDKVKDDVKDDKDNILHKKNDNTTYARAIEARFCKEMLNAENKQIKSIKDISLQANLSHRTKNFVNRYELVHHIPNTLSGYSFTTFYDNFNKDYIIAFRGTESIRI